MLQLSWRKIGLAAALLLCLCGYAAAEEDNYLTDTDEEILQIRLSLDEKIRKDDFSGVEKVVADAERSPTQRTSSGRIVQDYLEPLAWAPNCSYKAEAYGQGAGSADDVKQCWISSEAKLKAWQLAYPQSVLPAIGLSEILVEHAAQPESTDRNLYTYQQGLLKKAAQTLDGVAEKRRDVSWYVQRMRVATAEGMASPGFWRLFKSADAKYPGHARIYRQAASYFLPSNGGDPKQLEKLARFAVDRTVATDGQGMYAQVYDQAIQMQGGLSWKAYRETSLRWPDLAAGFQNLVSRFPTPFNLRRFAVHVCLAQDMPTLEMLRKRLGDQWAASGQGAVTGWTDSGAPERCGQQLDRYKAQQPLPAPAKPVERV